MMMTQIASKATGDTSLPNLKHWNIFVCIIYQLGHSYLNTEGEQYKIELSPIGQNFL
jgi:hypothetical protein